MRVAMHRARSVAVALAIGFLAPAAATAQEPASPDQETVYVTADALFPTMVQLPTDYDEEEAWPLIVALHGHGGRQIDFFAPPAQLFRLVGVIYAVPQAPYAYQPSSSIGYSWNLRDVDDDAADPGNELTIRYILEVVDSLRARYNVGDVYLMGFSQGGAFTFATALAHPDRFTGFAAFGSSLDPEWFSDEELAAASHLRAFVSAGTSDTYAEPRRARDLLEAAGFEVELFEFDAGHTITREAINHFIEWLHR